jgi:hypothetical protein
MFHSFDLPIYKFARKRPTERNGLCFFVAFDASAVGNPIGAGRIGTVT